jgi:hypothetical protein
MQVFLIVQNVVHTATNELQKLKKKKDWQLTYKVTLRGVRESLLQWTSNKYYIFVRVRARVSVPGRVYMRVREGSVAYPAWNTYAPYCDVIHGP